MNSRFIIRPDQGTLQQWAEKMVPARDVWYWDDSLADIDISGQKLLDRREYLDHPTYSGIEYVNAYCHWCIPAKVQMVLVSDPEWIRLLTVDDRKRVLAGQVELDRGLIFPRTHFDSVPEALLPHGVGEKIVISRAAWMSLEKADQYTALKREALLWDDGDCLPVPNAVPEHIKLVANSYGDTHGANCLSTTAFCISGDEPIRLQWIFQPAFIEILDEHGFRPSDDKTPSDGDAVAFSSDTTVVHAAYCVADNRFVNKNGQSMFNPVRIVNRATLDADWSDRDVTVYRRRAS